MGEFKGSVPTGSRVVAMAPELGMAYNGHWKFPEQMGPPHIGFIYLVRDNVLKRFYLGKKKFITLDRGRPVRDGWLYYKSSSKTMADIFKFRPSEEFDFICLEQYKSLGSLSYAETWTLCFVEAPTSKTWYNTRIEKVSWAVKEPISQRHKDRLAAAMAFQEV